jgi:N-acetylneuraminic acid mutarotase
MTRAYVMMLFAVGCSLDGSGKTHCETQADCLDGYTCNSASHTCEMGACMPKTVCGAGDCGAIDNGCGGTLTCGICPQPDHCTNGVKDPSESDVDCGGDCAACAIGSMCGATTDCATGTCDQNVCRAGTWATAATMPTSRTMPGAAVGVDNLIYVMGGYSETSAILGVNEVYNPTTNSWSTRAAMPTPRYGFAAVLAPDHKIWTIGGDYNSNLTSDGNSVKVEAYDPATNTWQTMPPLPQGRYVPAAAVATDGRIYVTGGFNWTQTYILPSVVSIAPGESSWTTLSSVMTTARDGHAAVALPDGRIYVVGGTSGGNELAACEYYQPGMTGWNTLTPMAIPRKDVAASALGGQIYVSGGNAWETSGIAFPRGLEVFDPGANTWHMAASLPYGRFDHAQVTGPDGKLYVFGGESDGDSTNTTDVVYVYTP